MITKNLKIFFASLFASVAFFSLLNAFYVKIQNSSMAQEQIPLAAQSVMPKEYLVPDIKIEELNINARGAIAVTIDGYGNETVLFDKDSEKILPIASITKLLSALVVFDLKETYNMNDFIRIEKESAEQIGIKVLREGEYMRVEDLVYVSLINSSNDTAHALASIITEEAFVDLMNIYAREIGLNNTYFINSTGLDDDDNYNYSTAEDLVKLSRFILENYPEIFEITSYRKHSILNRDGLLRHTAVNTNILLDEFSQIIGGKTGWTVRSKGTLVIIMENPNGKGYLINVVLGANDRFKEMRELIEISRKMQQ